MDEDSSIADLQGVVKRFQSSGSFENIHFPWRDGDDVEYFIDVKLRQRNTVASLRNTMVAIGVGLTFGLLSPVLGGKVVESHDVTVSVSDESRELSRQQFTISTEGRFGVGVDGTEFAEELDDAQIEAMARELLERVCTVLARET